jgi:hypothetical protein
MSEEIIKPGYTRISAISSAYAGYCNAPAEVLEHARMRGEVVHGLIEKYFDDVPVEMTAETVGYMTSFHQFWDPLEKESKVLLKERRFYDDTLMITGKCDFITKIDGVITLVDWKCTYKNAKHWEIQAAGYYVLFGKFLGKNKIGKMIFVRLRKDGKYPEITEYERDPDIFMKAYELYNKYFKDPNYNTEDE